MLLPKLLFDIVHLLPDVVKVPFGMTGHLNFPFFCIAVCDPLEMEIAFGMKFAKSLFFFGSLSNPLIKHFCYSTSFEENEIFVRWGLFFHLVLFVILLVVSSLGGGSFRLLATGI